MRRAARVDRNQSEIVTALRKVGASVQTIHQLGRGVPDLLVGFRGQSFLLELKSDGGQLTPDEHHWHQMWHGQVDIVRSVDEALRVIGAIP